MDKQELEALYRQIQADDPRNYQPEFPYPNPDRNNITPEEIEGTYTIEEVIKQLQEQS